MPIKNFDASNAQPFPQEQGGSLANNSGQGPNTPVLDIVAKKFNWGAFLLNWIWGLGNKTFITLIIFLVSIIGVIPFVGFLAVLGCQIWFGIKGNEWAWQNKRWNSVEHFHDVQKKWATAGVIICVIFYTFAAITFFSFLSLGTSGLQTY